MYDNFNDSRSNDIGEKGNSISHSPTSFNISFYYQFFNNISVVVLNLSRPKL